MGKTALQKHLSRIGKMGATKRAASLTPLERSAIAKKAAEARWKKKTDHTKTPALVVDPATPTV